MTVKGKPGPLTEQNVQWDDGGSATHRAERAVSGFAAPSAQALRSVHL